jgi:hypothetical protein
VLRKEFQVAAAEIIVCNSSRSERRRRRRRRRRESKKDTTPTYLTVNVKKEDLLGCLVLLLEGRWAPRRSALWDLRV